MSFATLTQKSNAGSRVLVQLHIGTRNIQWVNAGAGIWYVNFDALYPEVDASLLDGFTAQTFADIGSVYVDAVMLEPVTSISAITGGTFYFDSANDEVYICTPFYDDPVLHDIALGVIYGYSFNEFSPVGASFYEGRMKGNPSVKISRDPLFFGRLQYNFGSVSLINTDGGLDSLAGLDIYGNEARVYFGYDDLSIDDYLRLYSGIVSSVSIGEMSADVEIIDRRQTLQRQITYTCSDKNALDAIVEILETWFGIAYSDIYYDTTAWATAQALAPNVTIDIGPEKNTEEISASDLIEKICGSVPGVFLANGDGRYSFKVLGASATATTTIAATDVIGRNIVRYDPTDVISSVKVVYGTNWDTGSVETYIDTSREPDVFQRYKTYTQREFETLLPDAAAAATYASAILDEFDAIHGEGSVEVPMRYYALEVGDAVNIEWKRGASTMLATAECEITGIQYNLASATMLINYRVK